MKLRFPPSQIKGLAQQYIVNASDREVRLAGEISNQVIPFYEKNGFLSKPYFLSVCAWKTQRSKPLCESNDTAMIKEVSTVSKQTECEQLRIEVWTLLRGVKWPTASTFLHFSFPDSYPILDFRALWSLSEDVPNQYDFKFWWRYTTFCRKLAAKHGVTMRTLDQALWQYSRLHQSG